MYIKAVLQQRPCTGSIQFCVVTVVRPNTHSTCGKGIFESAIKHLYWMSRSLASSALLIATPPPVTASHLQRKFPPLQPQPPISGISLTCSPPTINPLYIHCLIVYTLMPNSPRLILWFRPSSLTCSHLRPRKPACLPSPTLSFACRLLICCWSVWPELNW